MKQVLLLNPPPINGIRYTREGRCQEKENVLGTVKPPFTLALLASILQNKECDIRLLDANAEGISSKEIFERLSNVDFQPDIIIFATTTPTVDADMNALRTLNEYYSAMLVAFGPHVSGIPNETLEQYPWLDIVIIGEPEDPVVTICLAENIFEIDDRPSILHQHNLTKDTLSQPARITELDKLPYPAWDLLPLSEYKLPFINESYLMVETSRGCPYACDFCVVPLTHGEKFRARKAHKVVDEIQYGYERFGVRYFNLWADTFTLRKQFLLDFSEELQKRSLPVLWFGNTRIDTLSSLEVVRQLKASGCWMLSVGIEVAKDDIRNNFSKEYSKERIFKTINWLRESEIMTVSFFILGYLGENIENMKQTIKLALKVDPDFAAFYPAVPYPGTRFYQESERLGWLGSKDWHRYNYNDYVISNHVLKKEVILNLQKEAYRKFYLRPQVALRSLRLLSKSSSIMQAIELLWSRIR